MKFYVITFENGELCRHGEFETYIDCLKWAEEESNGNEYTIEEYESEDAYYNNL